MSDLLALNEAAEMCVTDVEKKKEFFKLVITMWLGITTRGLKTPTRRLKRILPQ